LREKLDENEECGGVSGGNGEIRTNAFSIDTDPILSQKVSGLSFQGWQRINRERTASRRCERKSWIVGRFMDQPRIWEHFRVEERR
jgi:hypothetical protein